MFKRQRKTLLEYSHSAIYKSDRLQVFFKTSVIKNVTIFTEKHLCWSLFFNKVAGLKAYNFIKKRLWHRCFPVNMAKLLRTAFFIEHLWWLLPDFLQNLLKTTVKKIIQKFLKNYFLFLAAAFLKITTLQVFRSFCLSWNMSEAYLEPIQRSRWGLLRILVHGFRGVFRTEWNI